MRVSSKINSGFLILMLLAIVVLGNQLSAINQMQTVTRELSDVNLAAATTVLEVQRLSNFLTDHSKRYLAARDPLYERLTLDYRNDLVEQIARLREYAKSGREQAAIAELSEALDEHTRVFNKLKALNQTWDLDDLPPDLTLAVNHLEAQSDVTLDAIRLAINERVTTASALGTRAERVAWIAGVFSFLLGVIVAGRILR
jgi:hypothetical protein